jgi:hypothetical protein
LTAPLAFFAAQRRPELVLLATTALAADLPARRAAATSPMLGLRAD